MDSAPESFAVGWFSPDLLPDPPVWRCSDGSVHWFEAGRLVTITGDHAERVWQHCQEYLCNPNWSSVEVTPFG